MEGFETAPFLMEELLNFASDIGEEEDDDDKAALDLPPPPPPPPPSSSSPEVEEEELEWLSNKDAFPEVETFVGILPAGSGGNFPKQRSPVSVLETSNSGAGVTIMSCCAGFQVPVKARSKRLRRKRLSAVPVQQWFWNNQHLEKKKKKSMKVERTTQFKTTSGRKCLHCQAEKTPQWRAGPDGPKTLCNACGVRYKSGRLVPEYRPASSPTFSTQLHSNSHRKIMEMRKVKQTEMG